MTSQHTEINAKSRGLFKILIIEDDARMMQAICRLLKEIGFNNHTHVQSGLEAIKIYSEQKFDLVILDLRISDIDGFMAGAALKGMELYREFYTPIIAVSHIDGKLKKETVKAGLDEFEKTPYDKASFEAKVVRLLSDLSLKRK